MNNEHVLSHTIFQNDKICGSILHAKSNEIIGSYEFHVTDNTFLAVINVYSEFQNKGIGYSVFKYCFDELNKINDLKFFVASWNISPEYSHLPNGQSTNLSIFLNGLENGLSENEALWITPTGKWLKKMGFTSANVSERNHERITAIFK